MTTMSASYDMAGGGGGYPIGLQVDPPQVQNRATVFFRIIMAIPAWIVAGVVGVAAAICVLITWFVVLFTGRAPAGLLNFIGGWLRWALRVQGYAYLLTGVYPPFSLEEAASYPIRPSFQAQLDARNRLTVFFRILLAVPHLVILWVLQYAAAIVALIAWFAALFTGAVPEGLHNFIAGWLRWYARAYGYTLLLTDEYPPFTFSQG